MQKNISELLMEIYFLENIVNNRYQINYFSFSNKIYRVLWALFYFIFFKYTPPQLFTYRSLVLKLWGSKIGANVRVYPSAKIWSPKNLSIGNGASIGPRALIYNQGHIAIGELSIISQDVTICASTHDYTKKSHPLITKDVTIGSKVWLCAESFVGPGVSIDDGVVLGARAVAKKNLTQWMVYDGNPCIQIKERNIENE